MALTGLVLLAALDTPAQHVFQSDALGWGWGYRAVDFDETFFVEGEAARDLLTPEVVEKLLALHGYVKPLDGSVSVAKSEVVVDVMTGTDDLDGAPPMIDRVLALCGSLVPSAPRSAPFR